MVSTYTANKSIEAPGFNDYIDSWQIPVNNDWAIIDLALGGSVSINTTGLSGNVTLLLAQYQPLKIVLTGTPTAAINYRVPSGVGGIWVVRNNTSGGFAVTVASLAGGSAVTIPAATNTLVTCDGTATGMFLAINTAPAAAGSTTQLQYNLAGVLAGSANFTFDGTTATLAGLSVTGSTVLGDAAGDTLTLTGTAIAIPNTVNFGSNTLFLQPTGTKVGIGTATLGAEMLTVAGVVYSTAGGFKFPDGTTQTSASASVAGSDTQVQFNDAGSFGAQSNFTFVKATGALTVASLTLSGTPLAVASGGTGVAASTGTVAVVLSNSPTLTGVPLAPTAASGTNTTQIATTAFVQDETGIRSGFRAMTDGVGRPFSALAKMTLSNAVFNVGGYWNNGTQRFTPPAGLYAFQVSLAGGVSNNSFTVLLYKNGALLGQAVTASSQTWGLSAGVNMVDQANGTDYYEAYWDGFTQNIPAATDAWFSAIGLQP